MRVKVRIIRDGDRWVVTDDGTFLKGLNAIADKYIKSKIGKFIAKLWNKYNPSILLARRLLNMKGGVIRVYADSRTDAEMKALKLRVVLEKQLVDVEEHYKRYRS